MKLNFYLEGSSVTPALYDYAMDADGVLWPSKRPGKGDVEPLCNTSEPALEYHDARNAVLITFSDFEQEAAQ